jgi:glycerophosphoryl diester phosphodiesterase
MVGVAPLLVCHRGASALAPENSLEAFRVAMDYGVHYSELDVHLNAQREIVVTHDPVDRPDLPRLEEVIALVRGRMGLYIELKGDGTGHAVANLLRAQTGAHVIVGSFRLELLEQFRSHGSNVPVSVLFGGGWEVAQMVTACRELRAAYAHPCTRPIDRELVDALHAADLQVMTPHTNDALEARAFVNIGVDVIASDDPRILVPLL